MRLLQRVVSAVLKGILPRLLDCNNIGADNLFFTQELRYDDILRYVHVVLVYLEFLWHVLLAVVMIHWRFDLGDFLLCISRLPAGLRYELASSSCPSHALAVTMAGSLDRFCESLARVLGLAC
jgi:hypothetical protein